MTDLTKPNMNMIVGLIVGLSVYAAWQLDGAIMQATIIGALIALAPLIALDVVTGDTTKRTDDED